MLLYFQMVSSMKTIISALIFVSTAAIADVPPRQLSEVKHLLDFIKNSGCIINRNGTDHPADKGISHIETKYDYFRDDISKIFENLTEQELQKYWERISPSEKEKYQKMAQ